MICMCMCAFSVKSVLSDVTAIIFVVACSSYNLVCREDGETVSPTLRFGVCMSCLTVRYDTKSI